MHEEYISKHLEKTPVSLEEAEMIIASLRSEIARLQIRIDYDAKTGLLSSDSFNEFSKYLHATKEHFDTLDEHQKAQEPLHIIVVIDLNNLKVINESRGYAAGDLAIKSAAYSLNSVIREEDKLFRINTAGDEFIGIIKLSNNMQQHNSFAKEITDRMRKTVSEDSEGTLSVAVGYSILEYSVDLEDAQVNAENQMKADKAKQKKNKNKDESEYMLNIFF